MSLQTKQLDAKHRLKCLCHLLHSGNRIISAVTGKRLLVDYCLMQNVDRNIAICDTCTSDYNKCN